jgi:hydroxyethylthiazole kinase-like uncharacterized protein yjeF
VTWISTGAQVRELDRRAIEDTGIASLALMETASHGVARAIRRSHHGDASRGVVVMCGSGNNGGDGYAISRWLKGWGYEVAILPVREPRSADAVVQRAAAQALGVPVVTSIGTPGLVVDAMLGTGVTTLVRGPVLEAMRALSATDCPVVAVDVPSGLDVDRGIALGPVAAATRTVTFARYKPGLLCGDGPSLAGQVELVDIGLARGPELACGRFMEVTSLRWPARDPGGHKGTSGRLAVVAGSRQMAGAAILACQGALAAGIGLITLVAPRGIESRVASLPPEVMWVCAGEGTVLERIPAHAVQGVDALVVGPGLGEGRPLPPGLAAALESLWRTAPQPMVFDADALPFASGGAGGPRVVTPHPGEAARMLGVSSAEVMADRFGMVERLAGQDRVALLKGRFTLVKSPGRLVEVNPRNSPALSTGGTGDVLAGVIGALLAHGIDVHRAACLGAWAHGRAGELVADSSDPWTPSAVTAALPRAIREIPS